MVAGYLLLVRCLPFLMLVIGYWLLCLVVCPLLLRYYGDKYADVSTGTSTIGAVNFGSGSAIGSDFTWGPKYMPITVIWLNGPNYAPWANSITVYMMAKGLDTCLTDASSDRKDPSHGKSRMLGFVFAREIVWSLRLVAI